MSFQTLLLVISYDIDVVLLCTFRTLFSWWWVAWLRGIECTKHLMLFACLTSASMNFIGCTVTWLCTKYDKNMNLYIPPMNGGKLAISDRSNCIRNNLSYYIISHIFLKKIFRGTKYWRASLYATPARNLLLPLAVHKPRSQIMISCRNIQGNNIWGLHSTLTSVWKF